MRPWRAKHPALAGPSRSPGGELGVDEICWDLAPAPWPSSAAVIALVVEVLPTIEDALTADLLEYVALALADRDDEVRAVRAVLSSTLALSHAHDAEIVRLRHRLADLLDARRRERMAA